jgi:hypothetical protein
VTGFRIFVASPGEILCLEAPPGVEEAYDLMVADGVPARRAAGMAVAAFKSGRDPVAWARHFVSVRQAVRT